ncbi:MAG TPA: LPS export ABC transporter periplasmic protein LptC [Nitrococcus sp.]|nr:LPS export ABC transporter periplasmic protein LptC [Nitrococcus sp.]
MANSRRVFPAAVLGLLAIFAWWIFDEQQRPAPQPATPPKIDYYFRDFELHVTRPDGRADYDVHGERMTHYQQSDVSLVEQPVWTVYMPSGAPWYGRSDNGRITAGGDEVQLEGDVRLHRPPTTANSEITLQTQRLHLRPREDYADTDMPVTVYGPDFRIDGIGARAWMSDQRVQLLTDVKGRYEVSSH